MTQNGQDSVPPGLDVSVVIPLYNKAAYVGRAVQSVLGQTVAPREIVVVDDGSTDDSHDVVAALAQSSPIVRLISQPNAGPSAARNRGITEAGAAWVAFLDADDVWLPHHLAGLAGLAARFPEAGLLAASYTEVHEGRHAAALAAADVARHEADGPGMALVADFFKRWCQGVFFFTSSVAIRRSDLLALGDMFPAGERLGEDHDVWFRIAERTPVAWTPVVGALYTVGLAESLTASLAVNEPLPCYRRLRDRLALPGFPDGQRQGARQLLATHWLNVARARVLSGDKAGARRLIADPVAARRPLYWLRTALVVAANCGPWPPLRLGRI